MVWATLVVFALVAYMDLTPLIQRRKWHAVAAFSFVFTIALTLAILSALRVPIPSAMAGMEQVVKWLGFGYRP
ncbi:MAG TPA: hypothetical protein VN446_03065 [Candidatus Acidoferrum sp.]|nr:hypothetical protein [Candidatus Acidoferrum sp.]